MRTCISPYRLSLLQLNISHWTHALAGMTSNADICRIKSSCMDNEGIKQRIDQCAIHPIPDLKTGMRKTFSFLNISGCLFHGGLCSCYDLPCLHIFWRIIQCNVIFRHFYRKAALILQLLFMTQRFQIRSCISYGASAGHHKINALISRKRSTAQPFLNNTGDTPCIGRGNDDPWTMGMQNLKGFVADTVKQISDFILQLCLYAVCRIRTVPCTCEILYHIAFSSAT